MPNSREVDDAVYQRALAIIHDHILNPTKRNITISGYDEWKVKSSDGDLYYAVSYDNDEGYECNCTYYQFKGQCKHIKTIKLVKERSIYCPMNGSEQEEII